VSKFELPETQYLSFIGNLPVVMCIWLPVYYYVIGFSLSQSNLQMCCAKSLQLYTEWIIQQEIAANGWLVHPKKCTISNGTPYILLRRLIQLVTAYHCYYIHMSWRKKRTVLEIYRVEISAGNRKN